jgi:hypothetical protein
MFLSDLTLRSNFFSMPPVDLEWHLVLDGYVTGMPSTVMLVSGDWTSVLASSKRYKRYLSQTLLPTLTGSLMCQIKYPLQADEHSQVFERDDLLHCSLLNAKGQVVSHCTMAVEEGFKYVYDADGSSGVAPKVYERSNALLAIQRNTPTGRSEVTLIFFSRICKTTTDELFTEFDTDLGDHRAVEMIVGVSHDVTHKQGPLQIGYKWFLFLVTWWSSSH